MTSAKIANDYDKVPYESFPYSNTDPEHLYTIARLFEMNAVNPKKSRVLELGCASGGNLIPMAIKYPNSEFVGVDYSSVQIDLAKKHKEKLGLKNIEFKELSIADIDAKFGKFDYIVVHGILSWVPKNIQDKILEICDKNLNENGISYVSYNTLPGWNMVKSIREMMLYHTAKFENPADKIREARLLLEFVKNGNGQNVDNAYVKSIQSEIDTLKTCSDSYLMHDHLEENNEPFYFHDIMAKADKNNLQYLGDSSIATMFIGNFPKETSEVLKKVGNDIVRAEQYMDFIRNRRFRSTLFCKKTAKINRNVKGERLKDFYITTKARITSDPKDIDMSSKINAEFQAENGTKFNITDKYLLTALLYLAEKNVAVQVKELLAEVKNRLGSLAKDNKFEEGLLNDFLILLFSGRAEISSFEPAYVTTISEKPKTSDLIRYQATYASWVTNQLSSRINVDLFGRVLVKYLDGGNNFDAIVEKMVKHVVNDEIAINENGQKITDKKQIEEKIKSLTDVTLKKMVPNGILVA
jgi:methyltransferase-like protein/2-polyprenyl-3-methyl-5-hydroxy-6-metoxy-1,4-benzoquinol methylase